MSCLGLHLVNEFSPSCFVPCAPNFALVNVGYISSQGRKDQVVIKCLELKFQLGHYFPTLEKLFNLLEHLYLLNKLALTTIQDYSKD